VKPIYDRNVRDLVVEALEDTRLVFVTCARQVGKTTLTREISSSAHPMRALTLEDQATRDGANSDPTGFVSGLDGPVLIDDIQRAPDPMLDHGRLRDRSSERLSMSCPGFHGDQVGGSTFTPVGVIVASRGCERASDSDRATSREAG
jgi:hypothetical protein